LASDAKVSAWSAGRRRFDRTDAQRLAPRADGGQEPCGLVGDEDERVPPGRLLEHLEQRVLGLLVGLVGMLDEHDTALGRDRRARRVEEPAPRGADDALARGA